MSAANPNYSHNTISSTLNYIFPGAKLLFFEHNYNYPTLYIKKYFENGLPYGSNICPWYREK